MNAATGLCFAVNQRRSKQQGPRTKDLKWRLRLRLLFQLLPYCAYVLVHSIQFGLHRPCERSHCHYLYRSSSGSSSGYVSISGCFCWPFNMALLFFVLPLFTQASRTSDALCYIMQETETDPQKWLSDSVIWIPAYLSSMSNLLPLTSLHSNLARCSRRSPCRCSHTLMAIAEFTPCRIDCCCRSYNWLRFYFNFNLR